MEPRIVATLHIEDDRFQQRVLAQYLKAAAADRAFAISHAPSEEEALRVFQPGRFQLVVVDYQLEQGDGLNCLKRIREQDAVVPVIALSATTSAEIAAALVKAGADDFLAKQTLNAKTLGQSVSAALARAEALQRRGAARPPRATRWEGLLDEMLDGFVTGLGDTWLARMDQLEGLLRQEQVPEEALEARVEQFGQALELGGKYSAESALRLVRPLLLEILVRLPRAAGA